MAAPVTNATWVTTATPASSTSIAGTTPASTAAGELLIAHFFYRNTSAVSTPATGYSHIRSDSVSTTFIQRMYWKAAVGADANPTFVIGTASVSGIAVYRIQGADTTTPIDASNGSGTTSTATAQGVTTTGADRLLLYACSMNASGTFTPPGGMSELYDFGTGTGTSIRTGTGDQEDFLTAGPTGTRACTPSSSPANIVATLVAINPAAGGPPPTVAEVTYTPAGPLFY